MALAQSARVRGMFRRGKIWWLRYTPLVGPQVRESLGTPDEIEAAGLALKVLEAAPLVHSDEMKSEIDAYVTQAKRTKTLSAASLLTRTSVLHKFAREAEVKHLRGFTAKTIEAWLFGQKVKQQSRITYLIYFCAFGTWLVKNKKLRANPAKEVKLGEVTPSVRRTFVVKSVVRELIANAPSDDMRFMLYCGFHTGMRINEIAEAAPGWFHLGQEGSKRRGHVQIGITPTFEPKGKLARSIPLSADFETFLRGFLSKLPPGARWCLRPDKQAGKKLLRYDLRRPFQRYVKSQGVECNPHDMRRSFCSNKLIDDSSLIFKVARWTGDTITTIQKHYAHLLSDDDDVEVGI